MNIKQRKNIPDCAKGNLIQPQQNTLHSVNINISVTDESYLECLSC